ncbi:MAG TPA: SRPBCC domain-containing protein [Anaeromyxobacter sp.]|nr:SRPBCC domain-containing protein [Anaeromyxobacter sp.]
MAIHIEERFRVNAPVQAVWDYLIDPRRVVGCLPGAELTEVVDDRTFNGAVKVKVGTVTVSYKGRVRIVEVDVSAHRVRMEGEGRESTVSQVDGAAEVVVRSDVDVVGRLVQLGRGMIEQVSHQIFQQFSACVRGTLEAEAAAKAAGTAPAPQPQRAEAVAAFPLLMRALWAWFLGLFRRKRATRA